MRQFGFIIRVSTIWQASSSYLMPNLGIFEHTRKPEDVGKFKAPSLRNVELTAPYMHDGSIATLEQVLDHYVAGRRTIKDGPYAGRGTIIQIKTRVSPASV